MLKLFVLVIGLIVGAGSAASWLISEPDATESSTVSSLSGESLQARLADLKARFRVAWAEGKSAGNQTEEHLRQRLDAYRKGARDLPTA